MIKYEVGFAKTYIKSIKKLDPTTRDLINKWIMKNLININNPRELSNFKMLKGKKYKGLCRYRIGNYRIICEIKDNELLILCLNVDNRKDIYK